MLFTDNPSILRLQCMMGTCYVDSNSILLEVSKKLGLSFQLLEAKWCYILWDGKASEIEKLHRFVEKGCVIFLELLRLTFPLLFFSPASNHLQWMFCHCHRTFTLTDSTKITNTFQMKPNKIRRRKLRPKSNLWFF